MMFMPQAEQRSTPAFTRLGRLAPLDEEAALALELAIQRPRRFRARRELQTEGEEISETLLVLDGWAARVHILEDGRRQILNFLLPGDLIGLCDQERPLASSTVIAITEVEVCTAPDARVSPSLRQAYGKSRALEEAHLLAQITRLGRLNAHERLSDFLLELLERLKLAGMATQGRFELPISQEVLADVMGLTSVHINRTLQTLRRDGTLIWKGRDFVLPKPDLLRQSTGRRPVRVSA